MPPSSRAATPAAKKTERKRITRSPFVGTPAASGGLYRSAPTQRQAQSGFTLLLCVLWVGGACSPPPPVAAPLVPRYALLPAATPRNRGYSPIGHIRAASNMRVSSVRLRQWNADGRVAPTCGQAARGPRSADPARAQPAE